MAALAAVYILWGSTTPAMKVGVVSLPPFFFAAIRFATAGTCVWLWCRARRVALPTAVEWRDAACSGVMMLAISNGLYLWTLQYLPSGIDSLVFALVPLWVAVLAFGLYGEWIAPLGALGLAIGLGGMAYLYLPSGMQHLPVLPSVVALTCSLTWALGAILQRRLRSSSVVQVSGMQMLSAAVVLCIMGLATREHLSVADFTPSALGALGFLIVFGSLVGFSAYLWLLNNVPTTLASTYAYVNPIVALAIGIGLLHETFSWQLAAGSATIVAGVALMAYATVRAKGASQTHSGHGADMAA